MQTIKLQSSRILITYCIKTIFSISAFNFLLINTPLCAASPPPTFKRIAKVSERADSAFVLNPGSEKPLILSANDVSRQLSLYRLLDEGAEKIAEGESLGHVWGATLYGVGSSAQIFLAYGLGRGDLTPPIRIVSYPLNLKESYTVKTIQTERAQINTFRAVNNKLLMTYFTSKYESETGFLIPTSDKTWTFEESLTTRMGTSSDSLGDITVIGRMYGDIQGQDGDILLIEGRQPALTLPTYRGVSSLLILPPLGAAPPQIAIGDGWHSNYGQLAQARFSILSPLPGTHRYALDLVHTFKTSYAINRISTTSPVPNAPLMLTTEKELIVAQLGKSWQFDTLYRQTDNSKVYDASFVNNYGDSFTVLMNDGDLSINRISLR